ncbi:MAG TPA: hypothetical protein VFK86_10590 [Bauldia sp.]|nr:hypothetical protein [Bauldia sp.]
MGRWKDAGFDAHNGGRDHYRHDGRGHHGDRDWDAQVAIVPVTGKSLPASTTAPVVSLTPAYPWLGQVLFGDQGNSADAYEGVYRLIDLNGDGDAADTGEHGVFFDAANASGLAAPAGNIFDIFQASNRFVFAGDGDTDTIYRLRDLNGDGDANDAGEANVWFSAAANAAGLTLPTPNGIAEGADGAIYVVNAGVASQPADAVYRLADLNGDGDANDTGEASVWVDLKTLNAASSAFDVSFIGNVAYVTDTNGGTPDTVYRLEDLNGNGRIDPGEGTVFISDAASYGAPIDIANAAQGDSILTYTWIGNAGDPPRVFRLTDLNGSKTIDDPGEAREVWNWDHMPEGFDASVGFSIAAGPNGDIVITTNGGTPGLRNVVRLTDLNGDGDCMDGGETLIALSNALDATAANRPRVVTYYDDGTSVDHPLTFREGGSPVKVALDLAVADADSTKLAGARVAIAGGFEKGDVLDVELPKGCGIKVAYDRKSGVLTLAGKGTAEEYQDILRSLTYESRNDSPSAALRHLTVTVHDERGLSGGSVSVATTVGVVADPKSSPLFGSNKDNTLKGSIRADVISALDGDDSVLAGRGHDRVSGGDGADRLDGDGGRDALAGDDGGDRIDGGKGDDTLFGGAGLDKLAGGRGADRFVFTGHSDRDIILDFNKKEDSIALVGITIGGIAVTDLADAASVAAAYGRHGVKYSFDNGATLILDGSGQHGDWFC